MATGHDAHRPALTLFAAELRAARQHAGLPVLAFNPQSWRNFTAEIKDRCP